MEIRRVCRVYFSATGTTDRVSEAIAGAAAEALGAARADFCISLPAAREGALRFGPDDLVVAATPVYAGRVPNLLLPFWRERVLGRGTPAVAAVLYGNRDFDDGLMELREVLRGNGLLPVAAGAFVGEHAFSHTLAAGRPDGADLALAAQLGRRAAERLRELERLPEEPAAVPGCLPLRPYYTPRDRHGEPIRDFLKAKPVTDLEKCLRCGLCAARRPLGAIDGTDFAQVTGRCMKCCACVKGCPAGAKYFDHPGFLYHKEELEAQYGGVRREVQLFF